ncbi:E3 ubiquitin-protein ligase HRD1 [Sporobolomyces salmoneus]|uniref:E3 ubiquitin-protein ligase HRD1 n=1 Tax=Sporobolomyces salmoneus TaxID=183962 RepID=UPI00317FACFB
MLSLSRLQAYGLVSTTIFVSTVINAFRQRSNFYAAAVYLSKSNACMMILWNQAIYQTVLFGKLLQVIFLGDLRLIEVERLQERGWFAVTETLLALTIFKDEFESSFVLLFVSLLFLKVFHWLASDRIEAMEQSANVSRLAHARMIGLLSLLWIADIVMVLFAADCILVEGPTVMIMFASEYMILVASVWATSMKYVITCIDMRREVQWEEKSIYVFYVELIADFFKLVTYLTFFGLTLTFYGLPLNILRDVYLTLRSFLLRLRDLRRYRLATKNMDTLYPNATREEMEQMTDKTCIICREDMEFQAVPGDQPQEGQPTPTSPPVATPRPAQRGPNETPKKLPCGHVFHFHCLKSWLERQQSCPTCRRPVLPQEQPNNTNNPPAAARRRREIAGGGAVGGDDAARQEANAQHQAVRQAQINLARNLGREAFEVIFPEMIFPEEAALPGEARQPTPTTPTLAPPPPPTHEQTPNAALPPSSQPGTGPSPQPSTSNQAVPSSTSTAPVDPSPTPRMRSLLSPPTPIRPSSSTPADSSNPLARFSLPNLDLPPSGEAGLYHIPPSFGNVDLDLSRLTPSTSRATTQVGYADVGYGAFPQFGGRVTNVPPPQGFAPAGSVRRPHNLEERIKEIRERMGQGTTGNSGGEGLPDDVTKNDQEESGEKKKDKGKGKEKAEESEETEQKEVVAESTDESTSTGVPAPSPREVALLAAERRRIAQTNRPPSPSSWVRRTDALAPWSEAAQSTPLPPSREPSPTPPTSRTPPVVPISSSSPSSTSTSIPRLIPLFDPSNPSNTPLYPTLASQSSLATTTLPSRRTSKERLAQEVDNLVQRGIEEKLKMLIGFQDRLEGLVDEMKTALSTTTASPGQGEPQKDEETGKDSEDLGDPEKVSVGDVDT